jgi:hypothetical protein
VNRWRKERADMNLSHRSNDAVSECIFFWRELNFGKNRKKLEFLWGNYGKLEIIVLPLFAAGRQLTLFAKDATAGAGRLKIGIFIFFN